MADIDEASVNGVVRQRVDWNTRKYTEYDENGVLTFTRDFDAVENALADAKALATQTATNKTQLTDLQSLKDRLTRLNAYSSDTEIVAALARTNSTAPTTAELNRLLKVMLRREARLTATLAVVVRLIDPRLLVDVTDTADVP